MTVEDNIFLNNHKQIKCSYKLVNRHFFFFAWLRTTSSGGFNHFFFFFSFQFYVTDVSFVIITALKTSSISYYECIDIGPDIILLVRDSLATSL